MRAESVNAVIYFASRLGYFVAMDTGGRVFDTSVASLSYKYTPIYLHCALSADGGGDLALCRALSELGPSLQDRNRMCFQDLRLSPLRPLCCLPIYYIWWCPSTWKTRYLGAEV